MPRLRLVTAVTFTLLEACCQIGEWCAVWRCPAGDWLCGCRCVCVCGGGAEVLQNLLVRLQNLGQLEALLGHALALLPAPPSLHVVAGPGAAAPPHKKPQVLPAAEIYIYICIYINICIYSSSFIYLGLFGICCPSHIS